MLFYRKVCSVAFLLTFFVFVVAKDHHLNTNGAFGNRHSIKDEPTIYPCDRSASIFTPSDSIPTVTIIDLNVSITVYVSMEQITVTWTPILNPCQDDFIGIYFVETPIPTGACDYVGYVFVEKKQSSASWAMFNLRRPLEFRYYSRDQHCSGNYSFVGKSSVVRPVNYNEPTQIHLAYGDRIDQMFVSFVTNSNVHVPRCKYGLNPSSLEWETNGTTITYTASDMCEGRANIWGPQNFIDPGFMHTILLNNLQPSTTYFYQVGTDEDGWSSVFSFTNRPVTGDSEVTIIAYGDMGLSPVEPGAQSTLDRVGARVMSTNITCLLHIGDISYAEGIGLLWDIFMTEIEPIASRVPYMVSIGNHEYDHVTGGDKDPSGAPGPGGFRPTWGDYGTDSGGECAVPMVRRFHSPSNGNGIFWYSFDVGPIHFVVYSNEHDFHRGSPQYMWLEQDLQSVNRSRTPWLITTSHRPMYSSQIIDPPYFIILMLQLYLEPLFYKYHVDMNLYAHIHSYERTCPMYQQRCVDDGITQVLIGMGGQDLVSYPYTGAEWSIYHDEEYGYTQFWANRTYLKFTYYHNADDAIADEFILKKPQSSIVCHDQLKNSDIDYLQELIHKCSVIIFSKPSCRYFGKAQKFLSEYKLNDKYYILEFNELLNTNEYQDELQKLTNDRCVPQIFINGKCIGDEEDLKNLFFFRSISLLK